VPLPPTIFLFQKRDDRPELVFKKIQPISAQDTKVLAKKKAGLRWNKKVFGQKAAGFGFASSRAEVVL
jgi:hypothetical protein